MDLSLPSNAFTISIQIIYFLYGVLVIFLWAAFFFVRKYFAWADFEAIYTALCMPLKGGAEAFSSSIFIYSFHIIFYSAFWGFLAYLSLENILLVIVLVVAPNWAFYRLFKIANKELKIIKFFKHKEKLVGEDFFAKHVKYPKKVEFKNGKTNLIIVLLESYERSYSYMKDGTDLSPNMRKIASKYTEFTNVKFGAYMVPTICALTSWFFGLPMKFYTTTLAGKFNNWGHKTQHNNDFKNTKSVFDILKKHGYTLHNIQGLKENFANQDLLFKAHGFSDIKAQEYFVSKGYKLDEHCGIWGFGDKFILEQSLNEINELNKSNESYCLFIQLIDSHGTTNFPFEKHYEDIRDNILHVDKCLDNFVKELEKIDLSNTAVMLMGDHQGGYGLGTGTLPANRSIYSIFLGKIKNISQERKNQAFSAVDVAPTLLELAGASWEHHSFGIGTSMFSDEPSLAQKLGLSKLNEGISKFSPYYRALMGSKILKGTNLITKIKKYFARRKRYKNCKIFAKSNGATDNNSYIAHGGGF